MPSSICLKALACVVGLGVLGLVPTASAQDRKADREVRQGRPTDEPAEPKGEPLFNQVEGRTTILSLKPDGSRVKKGELVCELDSAALKDTLTNQKITTQQAEASHKNAKLTLRIAEIAVGEYLEGTSKSNHLKPTGEIALAMSELKRAEDHLAQEQTTDAKLAIQKARLALERALARKEVLELLTVEKVLKGLQNDVKKAEADERSKMVTLNLEWAKEEELIEQIEKCKLYAPSDGRLAYPRAREGSPRPSIEAGASVREGQLLLRILPEAEPGASAK